jgi:hypothetical protein
VAQPSVDVHQHHSTALTGRQGHPVNASWLQASDEWKGRVTSYWWQLYTNFSRHGDGGEALLYDYNFDEPTGHGCLYNRQLHHSNCSINFDNIRARSAALHAAEPSLRSAVTAELCDPAIWLQAADRHGDGKD